jgi:hypothetical protein
MEVVMHKTIELVGGPLDGFRASVASNVQEYQKCMDCHWWAIYRDTGRTTGDGVALFQFIEYRAI